MTPGTQDLIEHLMRILPAPQAEMVYVEALNTGWRTAIGVYLDDLRPFPDGTPLSSAVTGRKCCDNWRGSVPPEPGSAWSELSFLRITSGAEETDSPFEELDDLRLAAEAKGLVYRN